MCRREVGKYRIRNRGKSDAYGATANAYRLPAARQRHRPCGYGGMQWLRMARKRDDTLNTIDRPAVAFQASGDRDNPSISVSDKAYCLAANPMSDRGQHLCYPNTARTLAARHDSSPCVDRGQNVVAYTAKRFSEYDEGCGTLRANGGDVGGGTESIVVERTLL